MTITRQGDWLSAKAGGEMAMVSAEKGNYIGLSEAGARVWELIEELPDLDAVCTELEREFDVAPEICLNEVQTFLKELAGHDAVALNPAPAA